MYDPKNETLRGIDLKKKVREIKVYLRIRKLKQSVKFALFHLSSMLKLSAWLKFIII